MIGVVTSLLGLFITACGNEYSSEQFNNISDDGSSAIESTIEAESDVLDESADATSVVINGKNYKIIGTSNANAGLKENYYTAAELYNSDSVTAVVKGTVQNVSYVYLEHCPFTVFTLEVSNWYKGNTDQTITIYEDGGYIPYSELADDFSAHEEEGQQTPDEDSVVDMTFMNAEHIKTGDTIIAFLKPTSAPMIDGSYQYVSSVYGRFILKEGAYVRNSLDVEDEDVYLKLQGGNDSGFETTLNDDEMEDLLTGK